jgi:hypothetical protein
MKFIQAIQFLRSDPSALLVVIDDDKVPAHMRAIKRYTRRFLFYFIKGRTLNRRSILLPCSRTYFEDIKMGASQLLVVEGGLLLATAHIPMHSGKIQTACTDTSWTSQCKCVFF